MQFFDNTIFPKKVFLTGADCFHLVLDKHAQKNKIGGNVMRKAFYFKENLCKEEVLTILNKSAILYWLCNIEFVPGFLLRKPYWKFLDKSQQIELTIHNEIEIKKIPQSILNRDITINAKKYIEADIVYYNNNTCAFVLSWNHILLDASGTILLVEHINQIINNEKIVTSNFFPTKEPKTNIYKYIKNMYEVKSFVQKSSKAPVSSVYKICQNPTKETKTQIINFNISDTVLINENALKCGARFGPTLFFIAVCMHTINEVQKQRNCESDIWLPVPYDARLAGAKAPIITNNVSFLFYRITQKELGNIAQTIAQLNKQMVHQIKIGMPKKYNIFLNMMRHIPLWLYYFLISKTGEGTFASFLYSSTGSKFEGLQFLFKKEIEDILMIPALTFPPGLTFVFLNNAQKCSINISYATDIIAPHEFHFIENKLKELLLTKNL